MTDDRSAALFARAVEVTPGGVNSPVRAFGPVGGVPRFIDRAAGPYLFDVDGSGKWTVRVTDGAVSVTEGAEDADVTITGDTETFERISKRELNPTTAYMTGKIKIKGDMGAALKLQKLF